MAIAPSEIRAKFPQDPSEWNGTDLSKMKEIHKAINRELIASGMDYRGIATKYEYNLSAFYRMTRLPQCIAYREWLGQAGRDKQIADANEVLATLTRVLREEGFDEHVTPGGDIIIKKNDTKDQLKAAELLAKAYGLLIEKQVQKTEQTIVVDIEGFDNEDIIDVEASE
jgi:phage terminase small subunit